MPGQYEPDPTSEPRPPRRSQWVVAAAVALLVLIVVVAGLINHASSPPRSAPAPAPSPDPSSQPLPRGQVMLGSGGTGQVFGVPTGFPLTPDGGVAAAVNDAVLAHTNPHLLVDDQRHAIEAAVLAPGFRGQHLNDATAAGLRQQVGLNEQGQVRDAATGGIDWTQQVRFQCLGQYGAYRSVSATPTHAEVQVWMPCVFGITPGSDGNGVSVLSTTAKSTVDNINGQWRWSEFSSQPGPRPAAATPVVSFAERGRLLGPGWQVPANASEQPGWEGN